MYVLSMYVCTCMYVYMYVSGMEKPRFPKRTGFRFLKIFFMFLGFSVQKDGYLDNRITI